MKESTVYLSSAYLAPIQYYVHLYAHKQCLIEQYENYTKQTYRNRCLIAAADGPLALTIPTERPQESKCLMRDIRISDHGKWRHLHWNALESAYRTSPYFEYYADDFRPFYEQKYTFLMDFNERLCDLICTLLDFQPNLGRTNDYKTDFTPDELDAREFISPKKEYTDDNLFHPIPYYQVFQEKHGFLPNLSIVDLLFNMGPEGLLILRDSMNPLNK